MAAMYRGRSPGPARKINYEARARPGPAALIYRPGLGLAHKFNYEARARPGRNNCACSRPG